MTYKLAALALGLAIVGTTHAGAQHCVAAEAEALLAKSLSPTPVFTVGISRVPVFGFRSTFGTVGNATDDGATGERIHEVAAGTLAERMQLFNGDAILAVNGTSLKTADSWYDAIAAARSRDGWVTLKIRSGRSGVIRYRTANVFTLKSR